MNKVTVINERNFWNRFRWKIFSWRYNYRRRWGPNIYQRIRSTIRDFQRYRRVWYVFYTNKYFDQRQSDIRITFDFSHPWWVGFSIIWKHKFLIVNYRKEYKDTKFPSKHTIKICK